MARRKSSTALFEVITTPAARPEKRAALGRPSLSLSVPKWWRRGDGSEAHQPAAAPSEPVSARAALADPNDPTANVSAANLRAARPAPEQVALQQVADQLVAQQQVAQPPAAPPEPARAIVAAPAIDAFEPDATDVAERPAKVYRTFSEDEAEHALSRTGMKMAFDGDRQEVMLRMRYTSAIVTAFAVLVVIGLAYIVGRRVSEGPQTAAAQPADPAPAAASSSASVKKGPVQSSVLAPAEKATTVTPAGGAVVPPQTPASYGFLDAPIANGVAQRTANMQYLIIQSYGPTQYQLALDTCDFLTKNGVPCTIVKDLPRAAGSKGWFTVVGVRGFARNYSDLPAYEAYRKKILELAPKAPDKSAFGRIKPYVYKWG